MPSENEADRASGDRPPRTIPEALQQAVDRFGGDEAVVDGTTRLSFRDLAERVDRLAGALVASGIERGDRVALWAPNSAAWVITSFAVYTVGAVLVPLNTRYRGEEAGHVLRTSRARLLFAVTDLLGSDLVALLADVAGLEGLEEIVVLEGPPRPGCTTLTEFTARATDAHGREVTRRRAAVTADEASDIIFTSGTTGKPKGAVLGHGASVRTYLAWSELVGLRRGDRYLVVYPFFHTAGLKSGVLACVLRGATILPHAVFDVVPVMERVAAERITMLPGPPTVFQSILNHPGIRVVRPVLSAPLGDRSRHRPRGRDPPHARRPAFRDGGDRLRPDRDDGHGQHVPPRRPARGDRHHRGATSPRSERAHRGRRGQLRGPG